MRIDFSNVTEVPGSGATTDQLERLNHRYAVARELAVGKRVLEVACGAGFGLGALESAADQVVGGDYTRNLLHVARSHYRNRVPLVQLDAQHLPFGSGSFDVVLMFEAIYYVPDAKAFLDEAARVLSPGGKILIVSVNCDWDEFGASPHSTTYYNAEGLQGLMAEVGLHDIRTDGAFPAAVAGGGLVSAVIGVIRRVVVALRLMPRTLEGRARLKRLVYGSLKPLPAELDHSIPPPQDLKPISRDVVHRVLYSHATRSE